MHHRLSGKVQVTVLENSRPVRTYPWQKNLVLDQGLDKVAKVLFNQLFAACAVGTGTQPTVKNPGTQATVSGTALVATGPSFTNGDLDADVVFSTGERHKISAFTDATHVTLLTSGNIVTPTAFTVQYTNQATLGNEMKRTVNYSQVPGANSSNVQPAAITLQRTFAFTPETSAITYTEVGFSDQSVAGPNLFSRILLAQPVTVLGPSANVPSGQQLQVTYQLAISFDFGQGAGIFFPGQTDTTITITNLPIQFTIWNYALSTTQPGQLAISVAGTVPAIVGETLIVSGCSVAGYNGTWTVLDTQSFTDQTNGLSTLFSLQVPYQSTASPTGGILTIPMTGYFYRGNLGIYLVNQFGDSAAPSPTDDEFFGFGEPSVVGQIWCSSAGDSFMGSNGNPTFIPPTIVDTAVVAPPPTYTAGTFYLDQTADINIVNANQSVTCFGYGRADRTNQIITYCWDQPHPLAVGSSLALTFRMSWNRD